MTNYNFKTKSSVIYGSERGFHAIDIESGSPYDLFIPTHQTPPIIPHAIVVLPESEGMELLLCYNDEGVYVNTYSEVTKDVMMQWGELPASVAYIRSGQVTFLRLKNSIKKKQLERPVYEILNMTYFLHYRDN